MCVCVYVYVRIVSVQTPESSSSSSMDSTCLTALPTETLGTLALEGSHQVPTGAAIVTRQCQTLVDICGEGDGVLRDNHKERSVYSRKKNLFL